MKVQMKNLGAPQAQIEQTTKDRPIANRLDIFAPIKDVEHISETLATRPTGIPVSL
jgi:hypothetical protein